MTSNVWILLCAVVVNFILMVACYSVSAISIKVKVSQINLLYNSISHYHANSSSFLNLIDCFRELGVEGVWIFGLRIVSDDMG